MTSSSRGVSADVSPGELTGRAGAPPGPVPGGPAAAAPAEPAAVEPANSPERPAPVARPRPEVPGPGGTGVVANRSTRRRVIDGASSASPVRTSWTAAT